MSTTLEHRHAASASSKPSVFPVLVNNPKTPVSNPERTSWSRPYPWSTIIPSVRRQESIEAALIGCALGESLAALSPSKLAHLSSDPQSIDPGRLAPSHRTEGMIVTVQAVLLSQAISEQFVSSLKQRIGWYRRLQPIAYARELIRSTGKANRLTAKFGDDPLIRALALSVLMQGHHDGALSWVLDSTQMSYENRWVTQASFLVATAGQVAQFQRTPHQTKVEQLIEDLQAATGSREIAQRLEALVDAKNQNRSVQAASEMLAGQERWQDHLVNNSLLAIYTYVRFPENIQKGIAELSEIQGDLRGVLPLYTSLATIHSSVASLPELWRQRLSLSPYSNAWIQQYVDRCVEWPHGPEDIQATRCLPLHPFGQFFRNLCRAFA